ncbi:hypothetical protein [Chryseobacterium oncorhynchi]|uniref:Uncharacterized protein n=1 Tax=Chryseobacterium oncorhynchi TaxID=741074 RepID=A0A316WF29_9FLAO|nr:hypothetical protein [Chryseobacterium oncorhynchi]PWN60032.1 hypothetical protein C1638_020920 [Chryseobacterium oncorhynchi]
MKNRNPHYVIFKVTGIERKVKKGSTLQINDRFVGMFFPLNNEVQFCDVNEEEWTFKVGMHCEIIDTI